MSQASIDSVQSWLSFELEQRGIDAVVYARHVLNFFLSSHFTTDLHLAKKEANIFARLPPGSNKTKPKHKYRKRSSSSPFLDEVALKKEMAADCLRSASDDVIRNNNDASIESLIEDLYMKLSSLNLLSDTSSNSDERRVGKPKEKRRESYHDAFPLLFNMPENATKVNNQLATVWNGQPIFKKQNQTAGEASKTDKENLVKPNNIKSNREAKWGTNKLSPQQMKANPKTKKLTCQRRCSRRRLHPFDCVKKSPRSNRPKSFHQQRKKERLEYDKENANEPRSNFNNMLPRKKNKFGNKAFKQNPSSQFKSRSFFDNVGATVNLQQMKNNDGFVNGFNYGKKITSCEKDISHLYSMGLPDFHKNSEDAPSSKWFRDPQSGCLEFEPSYKSRSSSDTSPSSVESWLWCPSPSLWDDNDEASSQSRFETIYKPPVRSSSDNQACQLWKDYEAIFSDVVQDSSPLDSASTRSDDKFTFIDANNNESFPNSDYNDDDSQLKQADLLSALNGPWQSDSYPLFVNDDENVCDLNGWFSTPVTTGQSRKEIWLKNSEALKDENQGLIFIRNEFSPACGNVSEKNRNGSLASWLHLDEFLCDLSFQIQDCCNLHWLFGWDLSDEYSSSKSYPFSLSSPFSNPGLHFSRLDDIYSNTLIRDGTCYDDDDNVFHQKLYAPTGAEELPWTLVLEEAQDPLALLSDGSYASQPSKQDTGSNKTSLEDCVTENQAWKSSLRIGNMWQSISGIRRVNVLYSEKQVDHEGTPTLPPSSCTHFRPIHENELDMSDVGTGSDLHEHMSSDSVDYVQSATDELVEAFFASPKKQHSSCDGCSDCDMKIRGLEQDLDNLLCDVTPKVAPQTSVKSLRPSFYKAGEDKSMQTSFEEHIKQIESGICQSLSIRPPKANSR